MTQNQFIEICNKHYIHPAIALEDEGLVSLLKKSANMQTIDDYLSTHF